nr:MAG TPA: hypothetical protein [Caudoviricetes sp.]
MTGANLLSISRAIASKSFYLAHRHYLRII